jgi:splicing factor 45
LQLLCELRCSSAPPLPSCVRRFRRGFRHTAASMRPAGGGLYGDLYGDGPADDGAAAAAAVEPAAPAAAATAKPAAPEPAATTVSAAPTVNKAPEPAAGKKKAWGVPKFMPQQRKRPAPSSAARTTAAALVAKKQKLQQQQQQQQLMSPKPEAEAKKPAARAATGGLYSYEVLDEYDPRRPHDYDRLVALRKKQKEIDAKMLVLKEAEEREQREREEEARARGESPPPDTGFHIPERPNERTSTAPDRSIVPIAAGRGRGRGVNLPAWMTKGEDGGDGAGRGGGGGGAGGGRGAGGVDGQLQSGFGPPPAENVAEKMMAKMGYRAGAGLGREEQGIRSSLMVQKTDRNSGVITQAATTAPAPPGVGEPSLQPTRVVLLLNMVGPGEVDSELEADTREECSKYGAVRRVAIREVTSVPSEQAVRIFVHFDSQDSATKAKVDLDGRFFGGRTVVSSYYDEGHFEEGKLVPPAVAAREERARNRFG